MKKPSFKKSPSSGVVHQIPPDWQKTLISSPNSFQVWESITPLARNEWICWIISAKKPETRARRMRIALENLSAGQHRPCCWAGCPHR